MTIKRAWYTPEPTLQLAVAAIAAGALLSACGGGDDDVPAAPSGPLRIVADPSAAFTLPPGSASEYDKHLMTATANAGVAGSFAAPPAPGTASYFDPAALRKQWCFTAENAGRPEELGDRNIVAATRLFDNMWAFGLRTVLQYAIQTEDGKVFLIDTLNSGTEAQDITVPSLEAAGLSPSLLIGAMPTHGHRDHHGGASYLQSTYGIPIYLGSADADAGKSATSPFIVTPIDSGNLQPQPFSFGGTSFTILSTPGHTPGTVSGIVPVKQDGQPYKLAFWGGTAMPGDLEKARQYLDGAERLYELSEAEKVDGTMHTHPFVDGSLAKIDAMGASPAPSENAFLIGHALAMRSLAVLRECSAAKVNQLDATAVMPAWHVTTLETERVSGSPGAQVSMRATLRNGFGNLQNAGVTFTFLPSGETCTGYTDEKGQAACTTGVASGARSVTASFAQAPLEDGTVQLGSTATLALP